MATEADVLANKVSCLQSINDDILAARKLQHSVSQAESARMEPGIADMRARQAAIAVQNYLGAPADPAFTDAIDKIDAATDDMKATAEIMKTATGFITNIAGYLGAAGKVVSALQGT